MPCDPSGSAMTRHKGPDDPAHLDFRAIYETANIGFLSRSHLGEFLGDEMAAKSGCAK